ncbi:hypothetical protein K501DRAFT_284053 [Backusella circina FSU 941]|nr:hypothetical protein K501DRAFT_284053 [Backusella circina FSU 941]
MSNKSLRIPVIPVKSTSREIQLVMRKCTQTHRNMLNYYYHRSRHKNKTFPDNNPTQSNA